MADDLPREMTDRLLRMVIQYSLWRRSEEERPALTQIALEEHPSRHEEVRAMAQTAAETLIQRGEERGEKKGRLAEAKELLLTLLRSRFDAIPEPVVHQINATTDLARLRAAVQLACRIGSMKEFTL